MCQAFGAAEKTALASCTSQDANPQIPHKSHEHMQTTSRVQYRMPSGVGSMKGWNLNWQSWTPMPKIKKSKQFLIRPASQALDACASLVQEARTADAKKHQMYTTTTRTRCQISRVMKYTANCCKCMSLITPNRIFHGKTFPHDFPWNDVVASRKRVAHWKPNNHQWRCQARP